MLRTYDLVSHPHPLNQPALLDSCCCVHRGSRRFFKLPEVIQVGGGEAGIYPRLVSMLETLRMRRAFPSWSVWHAQIIITTSKNRRE